MPGSIGEDVVAHDRVVRQMVEDRRFLAEQRQDGLVARELRQHDLDRDLIAGLDVVAAIDLAHAAGRDALVELVDAAELRADGRVRASGKICVLSSLITGNSPSAGQGGR